MAAPALVTGLAMLVLWVGAGGSTDEPAAPVPAGAVLGPGARPPDVPIARAGQVELRLPVDAERLTAVAFHPVDDPRVIEMQPTGPIPTHDSPRDGRPGPARAVVDIGAPAGTLVYSPVDGIVSAVSDYVVRGQVIGRQYGIEPLTATGIVVMVTHVEDHPGTTHPRVGQAVQAGRTPLGQIKDLSGIMEQEISRFTADAGNHVSIEVVRLDGP